ncbi:hornerin [Apis mellifera caucasica]|nr:hornerin [Apis mellifera caucasica]
MLGRNTFGCEGGGALVPTRGDSPSPRPFFHHVRGDLYIKALFWVAKASETTISLTYPVPYLTDKQLAYRNNTLFRINMRSLVILVLVAVAISRVSCRELKGDKRSSRLPLKGKRGIVDYSGGSSYNSPLISSGYTGGYSSAHSPSIPSIQSLGGGSMGYSLGSGGLGHNFGISLGGQHFGGAQSYSSPGLGSLAGGGGLFSPPSKNGPVTFGIHGGGGSSSTSSYSAPVYATGVHGLSSYGSGSSHQGISLSSMLGSGHSYGLPASSLGSGHALSMIHSISPGYAASGGLVIDSSSLGKGSSSYSLPLSSSHGSSSLSTGSSSSYALPVSSGSSHSGISALHSGSTASYSLPVSSGSSIGGHISFSGGSSTDSYSLPASSISASHPYVTVMSDASSSSSGSSSYSSPSSSYSAPASGSISSYSSPASSYSSSGYSGTSSSYSPIYSAPSTSYGTPMESHGSYSNLAARYVEYPGSKSYEDSTSNNKYDTISYSSPSGKY